MTLFWMIIILGIMVLVHELGHFLPAKLFGIEVPVFSIGFGKRLIGRQIGSTDYRISVFPFGGYVSLKGMDPGEYNGSDSEFLSKPVWQRIIVIFSGPFANLILAFVILFIIVNAYGIPQVRNMPLKDIQGSASAYLMPGDSIISVNENKIESFLDIYTNVSFGKENTFLLKRDNHIISVSFNVNDPDSFALIPYIKPVIGRIVSESPAEKAGLKEGDIIIAVNGEKISDWTEISEKVSDMYEQSITVGILRNDSAMIFEMIPQKYQITQGDSIINTGKIGIEYVTTIEYPTLAGSLKAAFNRMIFIGRAILDFLGMLVTGRAPANTVGGPIAIYSLIGENLKWGFDALLSFVAFFSLNLCIFNLIPFPPLDGSYIMIYLFEGIFRKRAGVKFMRAYQQVGFFVLILLIVFVTFNDILRVFK